MYKYNIYVNSPDKYYKKHILDKYYKKIYIIWGVKKIKKFMNIKILYKNIIKYIIDNLLFSDM